MNQQTTLSDFLTQAGSRFRVYDIGRRIQPLTPQQFRQFETGNAPYPFPLQQHAWFALLGWSDKGEGSEGQFIWFLRFPLDEQAQMQGSVREQFIGRLIDEHLKRKEAGDANSEPELPEESPFGFKPKEETMAVFHAIAAKSLSQAPSKFYAHAVDYLDGKPGWDQWAFVGIQGIADVAARLDEDNNAERVTAAVPQLPEAPLGALCSCLESATLPAGLEQALLERLSQALQAEPANPTLTAALLRSLGGSEQESATQQAVEQVLQSSQGTAVEVLAAVAARLWPVLQQPTIAKAFVEALANNSAGQEAFNQVMADLLYLPGMRVHLLAQLRDPERSEAVAKAVGAMFGGAL